MFEVGDIVSFQEATYNQILCKIGIVEQIFEYHDGGNWVTILIPSVNIRIGRAEREIKHVPRDEAMIWKLEN